MDISVTRFKNSCLEVIRGVERTGRPVAITRRGRVVARLHPCAGLPGRASLKPWERLQALGGKLLATAGEKVLRDEDFEALR
jgi:prevent-host-death family protein